MMNNLWKILGIVMVAVAVGALAIAAKNFDSKPLSDDATKPHYHMYEETVRKPSCTEHGVKLYICSCGYTYQETMGEPKGHKYGEWVSIQEPTEDAEGIRQRKCKHCDAVQEENYTVWLLSYEEYMALTPEEQQAYYESFEDFDAYFDWLNKAKEDYENNKDEIKIEGGGSLDLGDIIEGNS